MRNQRLVVAVLWTVSAVGCVQSDACDDCDSDLIYELEINDTAAQANWMGALYPADALQIDGHITHWGPDLYDGFAFVTGSPLEVEVRLWADDPNADLDLCVWDPVFGQFVTCFETNAQPEAGSFAILEGGKEFHLVVRSHSGNSGYLLQVIGHGPVYAAQAPVQSARPAAWAAYSPGIPREQRARPGAAALLLDFDAEGCLRETLPLRVLRMGRR